MKNTIEENTVRDLSTQLNEPKWLLDLRLKALDEFNKTPMPKLKYSMSVITDTSKIKFDEISPLNQINEIKSNEKIIVLSFQEALKNEKYSELIKKHFMTSIKNNKFTLFHKTLFGRGIFVYIPKNTETKTIHLDLNVK